MIQIKNQIKEQIELMNKLTSDYEANYAQMELDYQSLLDEKKVIQQQIEEQNFEQLETDLRNQKNNEKMRQFIVEHENEFNIQNLILWYEEEIINRCKDTAEARYQQINKLSQLLPDNDQLSDMRDVYFQEKLGQYNRKKLENSIMQNKIQVDHNEIMEVLNKLKIQADNKKKNNKWHKVLYILLVTGLRKGELACVEYNIKDKNKIELSNLLKGTKNHERFYLGDQQTLFNYFEYYKHSIKEDKQLICTSKTFQRNVEKLVIQYKIPVDNNHDLRNLYLAMINKIYNDNGKIQDSLVFKNLNIGHKTMEITLQSYDDYLAL